MTLIASNMMTIASGWRSVALDQYQYRGRWLARQKTATGGKCGEGYEVSRWALRSCETGFGWKGEPGTEHWQGCLNAAAVVSTGLVSRLS